VVFAAGADVASDGQELAETSGSLREKTLRTSDETKDGISNYNDSSSAASLNQTLICQKTHSSVADDDGDTDVNIKDSEDSGDADLSTTQTHLVENTRDSGGSSDDDEGANEDLRDDSSDEDDEEVSIL